MNENEVKTNTFTDDGRLLQTEYAIKNVSTAGTIMGMVCRDGVVLIGVNSVKSETTEKIYKLDERTYCAVAGLFGDANRIIKYARRKSILLSNEIDQSIKTKILCKYIGYEKQLYTKYGGTRPFGVSFLYAGYDDGKYVLYSTDPSGTVNQWVAWSIGCDEQSINSALINESLPNSNETEIVPNCSLEEATEFLLKKFSKARECTIEVAEKLEILHYTVEKQELLKKSSIRTILNKMIEKEAI